ncbi:CBS domain-containing protein [Acidiphilium acidophilum]|uniref:CBS domain-containing protein n=1 Tax=Acidiphilium acidophilum TaxID=76588 RepID=UPI002E8E64AD|nr:CBS domain-containing protein [Acidiphilium acidophilum]
MLIRDLMTPDPLTVHPDAPVEDIARLLVAKRINGVPVVDEDRHLLGIVTAADLIHRAADEEFYLQKSIWKENFWVSFLNPEDTHPNKAQGRIASEVMTNEVHSAAPDAASSVAARLMTDYHLTMLPVTEAEMVIGVISRIDLLRHLHELENLLPRNN